MDKSIENSVVAVRSIVEDLSEPQVITVDKTNGVLVYPIGLNVMPIKEFVDHERLTPEMVRDQTNLTNCTSFIKFINCYKSENSLAISKVRLSRRRILFLRLLTTQK